MLLNKLNPNFNQLDVDYLYHLGLDTTMNLKEQFNQIKYIIFTRSFFNADYIAKELIQKYYKLDNNIHITCNTIAKNERYHLYKINNCLIISHGIGSPSLLICLNEIVKLMYYAGATNYKFIRVGDGGGLGIATEQIIITNQGLNPKLLPQWSNIEFGEEVTYSSIVSKDLTNAIINANPQYKDKLVFGSVVSGSSFYNGQARLNGALKVNYSKEQRDNYFNKCLQHKVKGFDLETTCFIAFCNNFSIPASSLLLCVNDRLSELGDFEPHISSEQEYLSQLSILIDIISNYISQAKAGGV